MQTVSAALMRVFLAELLHALWWDRLKLANRCPPLLRSRLLTQTQFLNQGFVTRLILALDIIKKLTALVDHFDQTAT